MHRLIHTACCIVMLASPAYALAQWNLATNLPLQYKYMTVATECRSGIVEKCGPVAISEPNPPGAFGHMKTLKEYKDKTKVLIPLYIDHSQTNSSGVFSFTNGTKTFPHWTVSNALVHCGIHPEYLDQVSASRWWNTNNWDGLAKVISVMIWTDFLSDGLTNVTYNFGWTDFVSCDEANKSNLIHYVDGTSTTNGSSGLTVYGAVGFSFDTPAIPAWVFASERESIIHESQSSTIYTGLSHSAHLYGYATNYPLLGAAPFWTTTFNDIDSIGLAFGEWSYLQDAAGGSVVTNYRQSSGYLGGLPGPVSNHNPVAIIPVTCASTDREGLGIVINAAEWLLKWDQGTSSMKYIIDGI